MTVTCPAAANCTKSYDGSALTATASCTPGDGTTAKIEYKTTGTWSETAPSITNVNDGPLAVQVRATNPNYDTATCNYTRRLKPRVTISVVSK